MQTNSTEMKTGLLCCELYVERGNVDSCLKTFKSELIFKTKAHIKMITKSLKNKKCYQRKSDVINL